MPSSSFDDDRQNDKPAATKEFGFSPTLNRAKSERYSTPLPRWQRFIAWTLALWIPSFFYLGPLMLILPPFLFVWSPRAALVLLLIDIVLAFFPNKEWPWFRGLFEMWYELFDMHHNILIDPKNPAAAPKLDESKLNTLTILAMHPHGIIPIQGFLWPALCDQYMTRGQPMNPTGKPGLYGFGATTDAAMRIPLLRQVLCWLTAGSAHREVLKRGLEAGTNLYILPGGVAEIFVSEPGRHVVLAKRHGLMKLALRTGAVVVPMYVFGGTDFYEHLATYKPNRGIKNNKESCDSSSPSSWNLSSLLGPLLMKLSRNFKAGFTLFWGQYGLPMPFPVRKCCMVMGDPIKPVLNSQVGDAKLGGRDTCRPTPNPTEQQVEDLLARYTDALRRLFDQYKAEAGYPEAELEFWDAAEAEQVKEIRKQKETK